MTRIGVGKDDVLRIGLRRPIRMSCLMSLIPIKMGS